MFYILMFVGFMLLIAGIFLISVERDNIGLALVMAIAGIILVLSSFSVPQGKLAWKKLAATSTSKNWIIIDNSGGKTMRHWVLRNGFVESSSQSDGWQFYDSEGNLCYVSGDAFVMIVNNDINKFLADYKTKLNIPVEQVPLK